MAKDRSGIHAEYLGCLRAITAVHFEDFVDIAALESVFCFGKRQHGFEKFRLKIEILWPDLRLFRQNATEGSIS